MRDIRVAGVARICDALCPLRVRKWTAKATAGGKIDYYLCHFTCLTQRLTRQRDISQSELAPFVRTVSSDC
jgi:hypothetical protein